MQVKNVSVRKLSLKPTELSDGSMKMVGQITLRGTLDTDLAKALKIAKVEAIEAVKKFAVDREEETCALELVSLSGKEVLVSLPAAALHQWLASRRDNDILITVTARVDANGHSAIADFMLRHPSWSGTLSIEAAQKELDL